MQSIQKTYKFPLSNEYWDVAAQEFNQTKTIALASIFISLTIVLETFGYAIPLTFMDRKILLSFIPIAISAMLFGPLVALTTGFIADILGFFVSSSITPFPFFPGYTITAMLTAFIYSLFLYRTKITFLRIFLAKFIINIFVNALLGSVWLYIMYGKKTYWLYLYGGLIKNIILLPFEVICLYIVFQRVVPIAKSFDLIQYDVDDKIKIL